MTTDRSGGHVRFDHIAQQVSDIAAAVAWQRDIVPGTRVVYQDATWALVDSGGARLAFVLHDQHPDHVAYRVDDDELEALSVRHATPIATHRDASRSIYVAGPDGLQAEFVAYPQRSE